MRSLALRWHGEKELRTKLARRGFDTEAIQSALLRLTRERWIDDERYARSFARSRSSKHLGPDRIVRELRGRGVDAVTASRSVAAAAEEDPGGDHLATLCSKKIRALVARRGLDALLETRGRNKLIAWLLTQGYDYGDSSTVVDAQLRQLKRENDG